MTVEKIENQQRRLKILDDDEIKAVFGRPNFTYEDRCYYFSLSEPEKELVQELHSIKSKAYFVLQLGYFKARHLFFTFDLHEVEEDFQFVLKQHFNSRVVANLGPVGKVTHYKQQQLILELFNCRNCGPDERRRIKKNASRPFY